MKRPTIALCSILKNELKNLARFYDSVRGCFDEIHFTDTGSTDGSIEWIKDLQKTDPSVHLHHFKWCDDFAAARNASFEPAKTDYIMWMDLDDVLPSKEPFIGWRDKVMCLADYWLATYHYALDPKGRPACSFARERVIKRGLGLKWKYFVHEGIIPDQPGLVLQYAPTWAIHHLRDGDDLKADKSRNLSLFEKHKDNLDARMRYYWGKELFEAGKTLDAYQLLMDAVTDPSLEAHDRVMGIQYATLASVHLGQFDKAISLAHQGLALSPQRAELLVAIADCHLKQNRPGDAIPYYLAATRCGYHGQNNIQGPIFQLEEAYKQYPLNLLARIYLNAGDIPQGEAYAKEAISHGETPELSELIKKIEETKATVGTMQKPRKKTRDIVISAPPHGLYSWDPKIYAEKGVGGSETAAIEMAAWLHKLTDRRVIIFNPREKAETFDGVEYRPTTELPAYFRDHSPALHIAWRHGMKVSEDPFYVWCHDLGFQGLETKGTYSKVLAMSEFHGNYVHNFFGVPKEDIIVTRNGLNPERFKNLSFKKERGKVVYSSSPDRGLERALLVMDEVVKAAPHAKLHVYYGFDNMRKMGLDKDVAHLEAALKARPYVVFHGNLEQKSLTQELASAEVWLYPTNFLETFCITALEMLCCGVYPVARAWGALPDTLKLAAQQGDAALLDHDCKTQEEISAYAREVVSHLGKDHSMFYAPEAFSWKGVAEEWVKTFSLDKEDDACRLSNSTSQLTA